jgi:hypothetical protein
MSWHDEDGRGKTAKAHFIIIIIIITISTSTFPVFHLPPLIPLDWIPLTRLARLARLDSPPPDSHATTKERIRRNAGSSNRGIVAQSQSHSRNAAKVQSQSHQVQSQSHQVQGRKVAKSLESDSGIPAEQFVAGSSDRYLSER